MKRWDQFVRFCEKEALAPVHTKLYELSYINLIKEGNVWNEFSELGDMINLFSTNNADVYNRLNGIEFNTSFLTGDQNNEISISVKTGRYKDDARQYDSRLILLDLTQRGKAETNELQIEWFDNARANLNKTFVSILADKARLEWS
jgi:hypothetical protein